MCPRLPSEGYCIGADESPTHRLVFADSDGVEWCLPLDPPGDYALNMLRAVVVGRWVTYVPQRGMLVVQADPSLGDHDESVLVHVAWRLDGPRPLALLCPSVPPPPRHTVGR